MTVVAKKKGSQSFSVFVKGAPEKVASFCRPETGTDRDRESERGRERASLTGQRERQKDA